MTTTEAKSYPPFWSDDFDMDLPRVLPDLDEILGETADRRLWTYGGTSHGRLNHPAVWGGAAFFGSDDSGRWKPEDYFSGYDMVECTWREALRDAWPHTYLLYVDYVPMWNTEVLSPWFERLMYELRGWRRFPPGQVDIDRAYVRESLRTATGLMATFVSREAK